MPFGQRLQEVRRKNGMTQEEFAAQLKVSRQAVSKWESCRGYPEIEKIIFICNRYGVTMNELFALEENALGERLTIDQQTLPTMDDYVPSYYDLRLNDRTNAVYALQARLMELGYLTGEDVKADGMYGPDTSIAVSAFQAKVGTAATGNADALTQEKLFALNAPPAG